MIPAKTRYKMHNQELLAIVVALNGWLYYFQSYKYDIFVLINHNNFCQFMDKKNLSSRQVRWACNFLINYRQGKANAPTDILSYILNCTQDEEEALHVENIQIVYWLYFL